MTPTTTKDEIDVIDIDILKNESKNTSEEPSKTTSSFKPVKYFFKGLFVFLEILKVLVRSFKIFSIFSDKEKTKAEIALDNGRDYVKSKIMIRKNKKKLINYDSKDKISFKMIRDVGTFLENLNNISFPLQRTESMNKIKFNRKVSNEPQLCVPKLVKSKIRKSLPDLLNFDDFKDKNDFEAFELNDPEDNIEREFVRQIWNTWFDEVIPFFNDGNESENQETQEIFDEARTIAETNDDKNSTNIKVAKSVTYELASQIDISIRMDSPEMRIIVEVQEEINQLTKKIESKSDAFSLSRRGALYRKV